MGFQFWQERSGERNCLANFKSIETTGRRVCRLACGGIRRHLPFVYFSFFHTSPSPSLCPFSSRIHPSVPSKHSSITQHVYVSFILHCRPQTLSPSSIDTFVEATSHDTKAESSVTVASLTPHRLNLHAPGANVILFTTHSHCYCHLPKDSYLGLRAC